MKAVFADSLYWIAIARPGDPWSAAARKARAELGDVRIVTTDEVLPNSWHSREAARNCASRQRV